MLLYKKNDIIAIQKKFDISDNANQMAVHQSNKVKIFINLYELLLELIGNLILIQKNLNIDSNPVLEVEYQSNIAHEAFTDISIRKIYNLLLFLKDDIVTIQNKFSIVSYFNKEKAKKADKNAKVYF